MDGKVAAVFWSHLTNMADILRADDSVAERLKLADVMDAFNSASPRVQAKLKENVAIVLTFLDTLQGRFAG